MQILSLCAGTLQDMRATVSLTLQEYKATLTSQDQTISGLREESQAQQEVIQALEEKLAQLECRLKGASSGKECLEFKVAQLSQQLEGE